MSLDISSVGTLNAIAAKNTNATQIKQALEQKATALQETQDEAVVLQTDGNIDDAGATTNNTTTAATNTTGETTTTASAEELTQQKEAIEALITQLTQEADELKNLLNQQNAEIEQLNEQYKAETDKLSELEEEFDDKQNKLADLNEEIAYEQQAEQKRYDGKINDITQSAINNYDPEKDGDDFDAFLNKQLNSAGIGNYSALDSLNSDAVSLADEVNSLLSDIKSQTKTVRSLADDISIKQKAASATKTKLDAKNTEIEAQDTQLQTVKTQISKLNGSGLTAGEVLAQISDAEKALVTDNNIDLTEKLSDGSPKYVAAKGQDGSFHFYEMTSSGSATSLARKYGSTGSGLRGADIVPSGSGYMNGIQDAAEGQGRAVYTFSEVNECLTDGSACSTQKCYTTCSPLSFDVDGDGVNTTASTIRYDIDGDGKLDTINNSAEWVLAFDKDGNGIAGEDGSELFGDNTDLDGDGVKDGYANGFEALKALAQKENLIDGVNDNKLDKDDLKYLQEKYGLVMTNGYGGEAKSLEELGITEINLAQTNDTKLTKNFDGRNNNIMTQEGATFKVNGETREYADIWNAKLDSPTYVTSQNNDTSKTAKSSVRTETLNVQNVDLDSALSFLSKADSLTAGNAYTKEVDYQSAVAENKSFAKMEEAAMQKAEDAKDSVTDLTFEENGQDEDFIKFQKKKIK